MSFMLKGLEVKKIKPKAPRNIYAGPVVEPDPPKPVVVDDPKPVTAGPRRGRGPGKPKKELDENSEEKPEGGEEL